jgi:peptide/nickel transport system substrate-binding protein
MVDNLYFDIVPDASTRLSGLQTGQYKIAINMAVDHAAQVKSDPNLKPLAESGNFTGLVFNKKAGPMVNQALRKAVFTAIDPVAILKAGQSNEQFYKISGTLSQPEMADSYTQAGLENYNKPDLNKAKQLIQDAGYHGETLRFLTTHDYDYMYNGAVVVQEELKAIGVNVDLRVTDWATVLANRAKPEAWDLFITGWSVEPTPLAYIFLQPTWPGWTDDPAITQAMAAVNSASNAEEAKAHYAELQKSFYDYVAIAKFGDISSLTGIKKSVGGYDHLVGPILYNVYETQK